MPTSPPPTTRTLLPRGLLVAGIVLIALNLRVSLAGVGPLVGDIRAGTGLSNTALGLLTALPLLAFGVVSTLTPLATRRLGLEGTLAAALLLLAAGTGLRALPSVALLFAGTVALGVAIACGNVLLPALVKRDFPGHTGVMTSLYSSAMGVGATVAAGVSVPLAAALGWRGSLGAWAVPALVAFVVWLPQLRAHTRPRQGGSLRASLAHLGRSALAWQVALFMGLQSMTFYVLLAWLPDLLQSRGVDAAYAGWLLALSQGVGIFGTLLVPTWAGRLYDQRLPVALLLLLETVGIGGLLLPGTTLAPFLVGLIGFALGGTFGLSLLFIVLRAPDTETATELSGVAQSVGYLLAATGPIVFGLLHDVTDAWTVPLVFLLLVIGGKVAMGLGAARRREIHPR